MIQLSFVIKKFLIFRPYPALRVKKQAKHEFKFRKIFGLSKGGLEQ